MKQKFYEKIDWFLTCNCINACKDSKGFFQMSHNVLWQNELGLLHTNRCLKGHRRSLLHKALNPIYVHWLAEGCQCIWLQPWVHQEVPIFGFNNKNKISLTCHVLLNLSRWIRDQLSFTQKIAICSAKTPILSFNKCTK